MMHHGSRDTIVALATAPGQAAIALIRLSGPEAISIAESFFFTRAMRPKKLPTDNSGRVYFGLFVHNGVIIDEVLLSVFVAPFSYTGENTVEISCHGSLFIQQQIIGLLLGAGARAAAPGEFTLRAFLNGKLDLTQAEAVADLIASNSAVSHEVAMKQMRGGFSAKIAGLRTQLLDFASLIELELDFSEEDVEFADRSQLEGLLSRIISAIAQMVESFDLGNVIKHGVPVAIVGKPNAGKSTLLNVLLEDERAIVSEIPGTTRDLIEDELVIEGVLFRLIDTAGLRTTADVIEQIGVNKAYEVIKTSAIIIYLFDAQEFGEADVKHERNALLEVTANSDLLLVANKIDQEDAKALREEFSDLPGVVFISAREKINIEDLKKRLLELFNSRAQGMGDIIVTNARHAQALKNAGAALEKVKAGLSDRIPGDLLALDLRYALNELGHITGQVTSEDLLGNIFSRFCIGK